jgi:DNA-binding PadR family transcriptional regulator
MGMVWDLELPPEEKLTLLALADHADHDGGNAHPGVELLARKTGYSVRQIQYNLKKLKDKDLIRPVVAPEGGRGRVTTYQIFPERVQAVHPLDSERVQAVHPLAAEKGAIHDKKGCNPRQERVQSTVAHIRKNHHEPSMNLSLSARPRVIAPEPAPAPEREREQASPAPSRAESKFSMMVCSEFAGTLPGVRSPQGLGRVIWLDGSHDAAIENWLNQKENPKPAFEETAPEAPRQPCQHCADTGYQHTRKNGREGLRPCVCEKVPRSQRSQFPLCEPDYRLDDRGFWIQRQQQAQIA